MINFDDFKCPFKTQEEIDQAADEYYQDYWGREELPVDVELIIEKCGIEVVPKAMSENVDAYLTTSATAILVNLRTYTDDRYGTRVRFSLAHELGHYALHRPIIEQMQYHDLQEYLRFYAGLPEREHAFFEYQANEFAGRLLVPRGTLVNKIREVLKPNMSDRLRQLLGDDPDMVLSYIAPSLCKPFGVSEDVIIRRVQKEGLWPPTV